MPILTAAQAQQAIQTVNTQAEFYNVFNSVDVRAAGSTTILYSGKLGGISVTNTGIPAGANAGFRFSLLSG